jgi:hypothetical protein
LPEREMRLPDPPEEKRGQNRERSRYALPDHPSNAIDDGGRLEHKPKMSRPIPIEKCQWIKNWECPRWVFEDESRAGWVESVRIEPASQIVGGFPVNMKISVIEFGDMKELEESRQGERREKKIQPTETLGGKEGNGILHSHLS